MASSLVALLDTTEAYLSNTSARLQNELRESASAERVAAMQRHIESNSIRMNVDTSAPERLMHLDNTTVTSMYYGGRSSEVGIVSSNSLAKNESVSTWYFSEYFRDIVRYLYSNHRYTMKSIVFNSAAKFTMKKIVDEDSTRDRERLAGTTTYTSTRNSYQRKKSVSGCRPSRNEDSMVLQNTRFSYSKLKLTNLNTTRRVDSKHIGLPYKMHVSFFAGNMVYRLHDTREGLGFKKGQTLARGYSDVQTELEKARLLLFDEVHSMTVSEDSTFVKLQLTFDKKFLDEYFVDKALVYAGWMFKNILNNFNYTQEYRLHSTRPLVVQLEILYDPARYHYSPPHIRSRLDDRVQEELFNNERESNYNIARNRAVDFDDLYLTDSTSTRTTTPSPFGNTLREATTSTGTYRPNSRREEMMLNNKNEEASRMRAEPIYQASKVFKVFEVTGTGIEDFYEKKVNIIYQFASTKRVKACREAFEENDTVIRNLVKTIKYLK